MEPEIALITILTDDLPNLVNFYRDVLGFVTENEMEQYVEFATDRVRFAICERSVMFEATGDDVFRQQPAGQSFELAFPCRSPEAVNETYDSLIAQGATPVQAPGDMPWGQRTAFFADPDGNIHEIFADLPQTR